MQNAKIFLVALGCLLGALDATAQAPANLPPNQSRPSPYEEARDTYVKAALVQTQAYRKQLDAAVKATPADQERYTEPYRLLKQLDELILRLRSAAPSEFDAVKAMFERTRESLDRSLSRAE